MYLSRWIILFLISDANALAELTILHSPPSLEFSKEKRILEENLKDMYLASLGLTNPRSSTFKGMKVIDPFDLPEAVVEIYVEGVRNIENLRFLQKYKLITSKYLPITFNAVKSRITKMFGVDKPNIVNIDFTSNVQVNENRKIFGELKPEKPTTTHLRYLKYDHLQDYDFLTELEYLKAVVVKVNSGKIFPNAYMDYYKIKIRKIHELSEGYGKNSAQVNEAKNLLVNVLRDLKKAFVNAYNGSVLITIIASDDIRGRKPRVVKERQGEELIDPMFTRQRFRTTTLSPKQHRLLYPQIDVTPLREFEYWADYENGTVTKAMPDGATISQTTSMSVTDAPSYGARVDEDDPDFPLRFNLIFWFVLTYIYALIASIYFVMRMKPDQNSIIYRMSNIRAKKDH